MKFIQPLLAILTAGVLTGCQTYPRSGSPPETTKYSIENTGKFVRVDRTAPVAVTCTGLQEHALTDGRLDVVANLKNLEDRPLEVEVRCVFKDEHGFSTGDETPWKTLAIDGGATEAVHYTAVNNLAHNYTVAVRQPRRSD